MKKFILTLSILLGLVSLTACDDSTSISYVDANGEEQTVKVTATEDKETIQTVIDYASKAQYDNITSFTLKENISVSATLAKDVNDLLELGAKDKLSGSASMTLQVSKKDGMDLSMSGNLSLGKDNYGKLNANILYNGELDEMLLNDEYLYVDAGYDFKTIGNSSKADIKKAYSPATILDEIEDIIDDFIPSNAPSIGDEEQMDVEEFYNTFKNSTLVISNVKNGIIYLQVNLALKDIINYVGSDSEELKPLLMLNSSFTISFGIEASTGRFREFGYEFDDVKLVNYVIFTFMKQTLPVSNLVEAFHLESKFSIEYDNAKIRTLSKEDKAKYSLAA